MRNVLSAAVLCCLRHCRAPQRARARVEDTYAFVGLSRVASCGATPVVCVHIHAFRAFQSGSATHSRHVTRRREERVLEERALPISTAAPPYYGRGCVRSQACQPLCPSGPVRVVQYDRYAWTIRLVCLTAGIRKLTHLRGPICLSSLAPPRPVGSPLNSSKP